MKYIEKNKTFAELEIYKLNEDASFKKLPSQLKKNLKETLIYEQGAICCYCGKRIEYHDSNIEHFLPKGKYVEKELDYNNLLSSCLGGQIERQVMKRFPLNCDAKKGQKEIKINPTDQYCEKCFDFDEDGNIYGKGSEANQAIITLGLNNDVLKHQRKAAIEAFSILDLSEDEWKKEIEYLSNRDKNKKFLPFCFVVKEYVINYKLCNI